MLHASSIWRHRDLRVMLPARAISQFGDDLVLIVLLLQVFAAGHGPWSVTGLLLCAALPVVVLAPVAGLLVGTVGYGAPFVVDAVTFVGLAAAATAIRTTRHAATAEQHEETAGYSVWRDPLLRTLILGVCALVLAGEMTNVVEVFLVRG